MRQVHPAAEATFKDAYLLDFLGLPDGHSETDLQRGLVAIELKIEEFPPEHLGKLKFYLEALDRDMRKPHECPSIGLLLCATKDSEVVEFALSRSLSPALIAEYQTQLPDKKLLQAKLHEFYILLDSPDELKMSRPRKPGNGKRRNRRDDRRIIPHKTLALRQILIDRCGQCSRTCKTSGPELSRVWLLSLAARNWR